MFGKVPFGEFAFMPGQIYHTNEVLVFLGDNWYTERSAKQAAEIAERRIQGKVYTYDFSFMIENWFPL